MVPAEKTPPPGGTEQSKDASQTQGVGRPVIPLARDDRKGGKFKEVLGKTLSEEKKEKAAAAVQGEDEEETALSPLTLASQTLVRKPKALDDAEDAPEYVADLGEEEQLVTPAVPQAIVKSISKDKGTLEIKEEVKAVPTPIVAVEKGKEEVKPAEIKVLIGEVIADDAKVVQVPVEKKKEVLQKTVETALDKPQPVPKKVVEAVSLPETAETEDVYTAEKSVAVTPTVTPKVLKKDYDAEAPVVEVSEEEVPLEEGVDKDVEKVLPRETKVKEVREEKEEAKVVAQVNLAAQPQAALEAPLATAINKVPEQAAKAREVLIRLASEMIERLERVTLPDRTDTTIKIGQPGIFNGAELVITEYKIAQRQFNVTFSGLSPEARALVAMQPNQEALRTALLERGYTLQSVIIEQKIPGLQSTTSEGTAPGKRDSRRGEAQADARGQDLTR